MKVAGGTGAKPLMISTVTNQGKAHWMIIDGAFKHEWLFEFFEAQIEDAPRTKAKPQKAATA